MRHVPALAAMCNVIATIAMWIKAPLSHSGAFSMSGSRTWTVSIRTHMKRALTPERIEVRLRDGSADLLFTQALIIVVGTTVLRTWADPGRRYDFTSNTLDRPLRGVPPPPCKLPWRALGA